MSGKFVVEVKNNGKTPALLTHFFVDFAIQASLPTLPDYQTKYIHYDWFGANEQKGTIREIEITPVNGQFPDVIYGAFHYKDFDHDDHEFRFILKMLPPRPIPTLPAMYRRLLALELGWPEMRPGHSLGKTQVDFPTDKSPGPFSGPENSPDYRRPV